MKIKIENVEVELIQKKYLASDNVARLCIRKGWYTKGNNNDYGKLLKYIDSLWGKTITDNVVKKIAMDIYDHSDIEGLCSVFSCESISYLIHIIDCITKEIEIMYEYK